MNHSIRLLQITLLFVLLTSCIESDSKDTFARTILMDTSYLSNTKKLVKNNDPIIKHAFEQLIEDAETALNEGPFSVTDKEKLPPSGDKHDYASYSRYWWPDPNQPNGLPYIRKDGKTNPASQNLQTSDRQRLGAFGVNTETLGLAFYLTGEEKYAIKAAENIRVWFLDEATRMNSNVNHAQCRQGHNTGTKSGILDGRLLIRALEGSLLITQSSAFSTSEQKRLKNWAKEYYEWLTTNKMALDESESKNNHGTYYDAQAMYFALYADNTEAAKKIATEFVKRRINPQIQQDGSMPQEIARTRPLFYSIFNIHAMFIVAHLAKKVDIDIWNTIEGDSRLKLALDYLVPYADPETTWHHPTIGELDRMDMFAILKMAHAVYPIENYSDLVNLLPIEKRNIHRAHLAYPLMR